MKLFMRCTMKMRVQYIHRNCKINAFHCVKIFPKRSIFSKISLKSATKCKKMSAFLNVQKFSKIGQRTLKTNEEKPWLLFFKSFCASPNQGRLFVFSPDQHIVVRFIVLLIVILSGCLLNWTFWFSSVGKAFSRFSIWYPAGFQLCWITTEKVKVLISYTSAVYIVK